MEVQYTQKSSNPGPTWLFLPGGPGCHSSYFNSLVELLDLPGSVYLIDMPGNGTDEEIDFNCWFDLFLPMVKRFDNPILVGHSFGGMMPLLFPELEELLSGLVLLHSTPKLWQEAAAQKAEKLGVASNGPEMANFAQNPSQETFAAALDACMPFYFAPENIEKGRAFCKGFPFNYHAAIWGLAKMEEIQFDAKWIPSKVPTLIIGSEYDCICPFELYDSRFDRGNIEKLYIKDAGHFGWLEKPDVYKEAFNSLLKKKSSS
ncbi:MAG: hypothetical protein SP1CHLAM42_15260 [Chlamydiales bacterium]|nr:hypothetical protein [Chlamydiales bacterium]